MNNNTALLTRGSAIYSQKRAKKRARPEELTFDPNKRLEFLTGFHKRKAERQKKAAEYLKEQERKERIETRKEIREARKADIEERLKSVNATIEGSDDDEKTEAEDTEINLPKKDSIWENHFEDAEKLTTVTVIEDFDQPGLETAEEVSKPTNPVPLKDAAVEGSKSSWKKEKSHPETKKKKFRYGTKNERQAERKKAKLKKQKHDSKRK